MLGRTLRARKEKIKLCEIIWSNSKITHIYVYVKIPIFDVIQKAASASDFMLTSEQEHSLSNMKTCRTSERGGQILCCPDCGSAMIVYNPCNQRGCPLCYKKNQIIWKKKRQKKLLPVSHYHLVFSIPQAFVSSWLCNKRKLIELLFSCVGSTIKSLGKENDLLLGSVLVFQSHGKGMSYKPHIHCVLTAGGINGNKKWIELGSIPYAKLAKKFREEFYQRITDDVALEYLTDKINLHDRDWKVHPTMHQKTGKWIMEYLSHSIAGVVINMNQDFIIDKENETILFSEMHSGKRIETVLTNKIFTERYLNHIPPSGEVMIRYFGLYSNLHAAELETLRKELAVSDDVEEIEQEEKVNICPICQGEMIVTMTFKPNELPLYIKYHYEHGPPEHGEMIIKSKNVS